MLSDAVARSDSFFSGHIVDLVLGSRKQTLHRRFGDRGPLRIPVDFRRLFPMSLPHTGKLENSTPVGGVFSEECRLIPFISDA
jgi:hypothetical protein